MSYRRVFDAGGADSLAKLARWVRPGSSVLELGAATGYFTEHLHAQGCTVDIVEVDAAAAAEAGRFARRMVVADLDADAWIREIGGAPSGYGRSQQPGSRSARKLSRTKVKSWVQTMPSPFTSACGYGVLQSVSPVP